MLALVLPGVEPHDWEPSPREMIEVRRARVLVYNGAGLEPWMARILQDAPPGTLAVNTTEGIPLRTEREHGHAHGTPAPGTVADPHVWLDPLLALRQVQAIRAGLERADPAGAPAYRANASAFEGQLRALDARYAAGLKDCDRREVVTAHAAFGYLTRRYGLVQTSVLGVTPDAEPTWRAWCSWPAAIACATSSRKRS